MRVTFSPKKLFLQTLCLFLAAGFAGTQAHAGGNIMLRPKAYLNSGARADDLVNELTANKKDGGNLSPVSGLDIDYKNNYNPSNPIDDMLDVSRVFLGDTDAKGNPYWTRPLKDLVPSNRNPGLIDAQNENELVYFGYRHVAAQGDQQVIEDNNLRFDITVLMPGIIHAQDPEFIMTKGHHHVITEKNPNWLYPEIYEVWQGKVLFIQQGSNEAGKLEFIATVCRPGDKMVMVPGYSHRSVNIGNEPLVMADWMSVNVGGYKINGKDATFADGRVKQQTASEFEDIHDNNGYAYYVMREPNGDMRFEFNTKYGSPAAVDAWYNDNAVKQIALNSDLSLDNQTPIYKFVQNQKTAKALGIFMRKGNPKINNVVRKGQQITPNMVVSDGGTVAHAEPPIKIFSENVIVGDDAKGSDVGKSLRLAKLVEEKLLALLGHSNTRKTYIKEVSAQIKAGLIAAGTVAQDKINQIAHDQAFLRFDQLMNHRILAQLKAGLAEISLCVGSDRDNLPVDEEIDDVIKQMKVSFAGVNSEQLGTRAFNVAWEPAGNIGTGVAEGPEKIRIVHEAIHNWFLRTYGENVINHVWGKSLRILYGASVDGKNVDGIMAVKNADGVQMVHGVLFASSGKKVEGFLEVAEGVNRAAVRDNAQYVCFINLKQFLAKDKTSIAEYVGAIYRAIMAGRIDPALTLLYITDQDVHLKTWQRAVRAVGESFDGGSAAIPAVNTFGKAELNGLRVFLRLDLNVSDAEGKIKSANRISEALDTIAYYIQNGATVVVASHNGRPDGKVVPELSLGPVAEKMQQLLKEGKYAQYNIKVAFHKDSVTEKGVKPGLRDEIVEGAVNVVENVRFAKGEQNDHESFYKDLAALAPDHFDFDAFGTGEREDAVKPARYAPTVSQGFLMQKEDKYLKEAVKVIYGLVIGGGPKLGEKLEVIKHVIANKKMPGGFTIWGTAPTTYFLDALYGIKLGDSKYTDEKRVNARKEGIRQVGEIIDISKKAGMENVIGVDFIAVDRDLTAIAEGKKSWVDLKKIPDGANIYQVTLEQLQAGKFQVGEGEDVKEILVNTLFLYDIGDKSKELFRKKILSTPEGRAAFYNGTVGVFEISQFASGGKVVGEALAELHRTGRISVVGGGDTVKELEKNKLAKLVTHASTGGGASAAVLKGAILAAIRELSRYQETINANMDKVTVTAQEFMRYLVADKAIFRAQGAAFYNKFIAGVKQSLGIKNGDLSTAQISAEKIYDSRNKETVRVKIAISGVEAVGEVPAGASKGQDEAATVSADQAIKNINEIIVPLLSKSGLDLRRHEDLKRAEELITKEAGKNYALLGANATVPLSWALWRAAAKLHNLELWEYIRWYEPQVVGRGLVDFYSNVFNGGLHALKAGETLGKDRIEIQEIMADIVGNRSAAERLAMDDKFDQELKKILLAEAQSMGLSPSDLTRADEAGFSLKGLGSSERAIELVAEAIKNAGYEPGKDVQLAIDTAATTFAREIKDSITGKISFVYDFQGTEMTGRQMIDFYISLAKKYPGFIRSIEDGLAENDWDNWVILTAEMKKLGIITIGDDLFVTQMERLQKGVAMNAASAILIKVNQNGSVSGTLEVIKYAMENGLEIVVSHRSGETLDPAIADLAYAVKAMAIKTGAPQPAADFTDPSTLVRRSKYLRLIEIEKNPYLFGKVLFVSEDSFKKGGVKNALSRLGELNDAVKVIVYGANADKLEALIHQDNVLTANSLQAAAAFLDNIGVKKDNMRFLSPAGSDKEIAEAGQLGIKNIDIDQFSTAAIAQGVKELMNSSAVNSLFSDFSASMQSVTSQVSDEVRRYQDAVTEFINKV
jgi:enolase